MEASTNQDEPGVVEPVFTSRDVIQMLTFCFWRSL